MKKKILFIGHSSAFSGGAEDDFVSMLSYFSEKANEYEIDAMFPRGPKSNLYTSFCRKTSFLMWGHLPVIYKNLWDYMKYSLKFFIHFYQIFKFVKESDYDLCIINVSVLIWPIIVLKILGYKELILLKETVEPYRVRRSLYKLFSTCAEYVVPNSGIMEKEYIEVTGKKNITTVYSAINEGKGSESSDLELDRIINPEVLKKMKNTNIFKLFCIGNVIEIKNQLVLIKALGKIKKDAPLKDIELFLVGDTGKERKYYELVLRCVKEFGLTEKVHFVGRLEKEAVIKLYSFMDALIISSKSEGIPLVLVYALMFKKFVISTGVGGISDVIKNGINGLITGTSEGEIAGTILKLNSEKEALSFLVENGYKTYLEKYNWKNNMEQLEEIIQNVINK